VYDLQTAQQLAESLLKADVEKRIGPGYAPLNHIMTTVNNIQKKDASGTLQLQITAAGAWSYQFQNEQKQTFARLIAGQQANQAMAKLLQQRGVRKAKIDLSLAYNNMLPADPRHIAIIWQPQS
jgi:VCBS repeat-containing protein